MAKSSNKESLSFLPLSNPKSLSHKQMRGSPESASRPLMGFGELNDNMIKGLTFLIEISWAGIYLYIIVCIVSCIKESNKRELIEQSQACSDEKWETSFHAMTIYGFYLWLDIFEEYLRFKIIESIVARLHGVKQKEKTYTYVLHIGLILWSLE